MYEQEAKMGCCEANSRANICDTAKINSSMLRDAVSAQRSLEGMLGGSAPIADANKREVSSQQDEVVAQRESLGELNCIINRICILLNG